MPWDSPLYLLLGPPQILYVVVVSDFGDHSWLWYNVGGQQGLQILRTFSIVAVSFFEHHCLCVHVYMSTFYFRCVLGYALLGDLVQFLGNKLIIVFHVAGPKLGPLNLSSEFSQSFIVPFVKCKFFRSRLRLGCIAC